MLRCGIETDNAIFERYMTIRPSDLDELASRVREAIRIELKISSQGLPFRVWDISGRGYLYLVLESEGKQSILDESMEEGKISWLGNTPGSAEIVSVLPLVSTVTVALTNGRPPVPGTLVYVHPPRYIEALLKIWEQSELARKLATWHYQLVENRITWSNHLPHSQFGTLRCRQRESFDLVRWKTSFLWGPPGTGKTYTLGRMLASHLVHYPSERVLLLASTNVAVDLAILAVDDALKEVDSHSAPVCLRFGSRFDPNKFINRKHLTPLRDKRLVEELWQHYHIVPEPADADQYDAWKHERDRLARAIRDQNRQFLSRASLVAMTTTLAAHDFSNLGGFDLVVFDEASQIGKAQAMTFAHLGKRSLYAGDPKQLAPIAQADNSDVIDWLGSSPFEWMRLSSMGTATCMLDEQSRMAAPIGAAVSSLFYDSKLRVADSAESDPQWRESRKAQTTELLGADNIVLLETHLAPEVARRFRGYECAGSVQLIGALVADHVLNWPVENVKDNVLILTPYRAQRRKIEEELRSIEVPLTLVSTVHRAQGSERKIVIFDPVCPTAEFVKGEEGRRLLNVAFSRAQCRLIVLLQQGWEMNPELHQLSKFSPPVHLDEAEVSKLSLAKLGLNRPAHRVSNKLPATPITSLVTSRTPLNDFSEELRNRLAPGLARGEIRRLAIELKDKAKYRKLAYHEIDAVIDEVSGSNP